MRLCNLFVSQNCKYCTFLFNRMTITSVDEVFISFVLQQIEVMTLCLSVCTGQTEAENYILSHTFLESK